MNTKMNKTADYDYKRPDIALVYVEVEQGFSLSGGIENVDKDDEIEF